MKKSVTRKYPKSDILWNSTSDSAIYMMEQNGSDFLISFKINSIAGIAKQPTISQEGKNP